MNPAGEFDQTATAPPRRPSEPEKSARDDLAAGAQLGHFRIEKKLGAGGMGDVYLATDLALDRPVAVKVLPAHRSSASAKERMVREARAQARVQHPNVAHIYFIGEDAGRLYFAMEYVAGKTLADAIADAPMTAEAALAAIRAAVLGLREAHRSGFTHRDVKPSNLMFDAHGVVKVLDFGLVAATAGEHGDGPVEQTSIAGTPLYMAPEQAHGDPIDLRADIYALGATLYHLVSGAPPFQGTNMAELVTQHETAARPTVPRGKNPRTVITALDRLIARMMAPAPKDRFASYDDLLASIDLISSEQVRSAGFGVRVAATLFDALVVVAFSTLGMFVLKVDSSANALVFAALLVFSTLLVWRTGATLGKSLFELQVVSWPSGDKPTFAQAFGRQSIMWMPLFLAAFLEEQLSSRFSILDAAGVIIPIYMMLCIVHLAMSAARRAGKRTIWDRASRTHVRYKRR